MHVEDDLLHHFWLRRNWHDDYHHDYQAPACRGHGECV